MNKQFSCRRKNIFNHFFFVINFNEKLSLSALVSFLSANHCVCNVHRKVALVMCSSLFEGSEKKQKLTAMAEILLVNLGVLFLQWVG